MPDLNLPAEAHVRDPRGAIKLNGAIVWGWISWEVDNNYFRAADTFRASFAIGDLDSAHSLAWFASQSPITLEIFATENWTGTGPYVPAAADSLVGGDIDDIAINLEQGTIDLTGRDKTALLIDTKTSENHQNSTSGQVATLLAQRHGLTPVVTATTTRIGQYYAIDHTDINQQVSEWDLLVRLANFENFDVFVKGNELHFGPKPTDSGARYAIIWAPPTEDRASPQANATTLSFSRSLTIAKGVVVEVRSWNAKQKKALKASWPKTAKAAKPGQSAGDALSYHRDIPGLTQDQAVARAKAIYDQIVAHMVKLDAGLPGDNILDCGKVIQVRGTGTALDQSYFPDSVKRSMSMDEGYRMELSAKNISQDLDEAS